LFVVCCWEKSPIINYFDLGFYLLMVDTTPKCHCELLIVARLIKKKPIHVSTGMAIRTVSQTVLNITQLPLISIVPVSRIDQG